jgi:hypothetical protein
MFKKILSLGALLAVSWIPSTAATVSFSDTVFTSLTPPNTLSFELTQFDPSLGTLTGILIEFSATLNGSFEFTNSTTTAGTVSGSLGGIFTLDGPGPLAMPLLVLNPSSNFGPVNVASMSTVPVVAPASMDSDSYFTSLAGEFVPFEGLATVGFSGTTEPLIGIFTNINPLGQQQTLLGEATVTVTYEFDAPGVPDVPEPMTLYLLGGGLLALSFIRRPRSNRKPA